MLKTYPTNPALLDCSFFYTYYKSPALHGWHYNKQLFLFQALPFWWGAHIITMTVYIYGCNCGSLGAYVRRARAYAQANGFDFEVKNSKYDTEHRQEHGQLLSQLELQSDTYEPILVEGVNVIALKSWQP